jgi:hypothetical protein
MRATPLRWWPRCPTKAAEMPNMEVDEMLSVEAFLVLHELLEEDHRCAQLFL